MTELGASPRPLGLATPSPPASDQIRDQVARILGAPEFAGGARTKRLLEYLVEQSLAGNEKKLKQYTIATEALGRSEGFDPEADPIVRLEAGKLRRALELYYLRVGHADPIRILVPKGGYVAVFETTASNLDAQLGVAAPAEPDAPLAARDPLDSQRVAVLPFTFPPGNEQAAAFVAGLFDQLVVVLAQYRDISVALQESGARFVLSGRVRQSETHLRATGRLEDLETGSIVWTEAFDIPNPALASLDTQDRLASSIAGAIADYYGVISHTRSLQAAYGPPTEWSLQRAIYRHRYLARTLTEGVYRLARADLQTAVRRAPDQPVVWAALAHTVFYGNVLGFDQEDEWEDRVFRATQRAFELDHRCAFAHVVSALHQLYQYRFDDVFETCNRILEHNPHAPSTRLSAGFFRTLAGDWENGVPMLTTALGTIMHPPAWVYRATFLDLFRREVFDAALNEVSKYHAPENFTPWVLRAAALSKLGRLDEAKRSAAEVMRLCPTFHTIEAEYFRYLVPTEALRRAMLQALRPTGLTDHLILSS